MSAPGTLRRIGSPWRPPVAPRIKSTSRSKRGDQGVIVVKEGKGRPRPQRGVYAAFRVTGAAEWKRDANSHFLVKPKTDKEKWRVPVCYTYTPCEPVVYGQFPQSLKMRNPYATFQEIASKDFDAAMERLAYLQATGKKEAARGSGGNINISTGRTWMPGILNVDILDDSRLMEGGKRRVTVNAYDRCVEARAQCLATHGTHCHVCGFDFGKVYGSIGQGFIHVHHLTPIAQSGEKRRINPEKDLRPVCPNCHAMLHRQTPPFELKQLREEIRWKNYPRKPKKQDSESA